MNVQGHPLHFKTGQDGGLAPTSTATVKVDAARDAVIDVDLKTGLFPSQGVNVGRCDLPLVWEGSSYDNVAAALLSILCFATQ